MCGVIHCARRRHVVRARTRGRSVDVPTDPAHAVSVENRINLRGGIASSDRNGRDVGLETCCTGAGLFGDV